MAEFPAFEGEPFPDRPRLATSWPVLAGCAAVTAGTIVGQGLAGPVPGENPLLYPIVALLITGAAIVALYRIPRAAITGPFVALAAASATLIGLLPYDRPAGEIPTGIWLIVSPWRYALPPLMVHFVLIVAWPQRIARWYGLVLGLYVLHAALWAATLCGLVIGESALTEAIDVSLRTIALEPVEWAVAVLCGIVALLGSDRTRARRRAIAFATVGVAAAFGPSLLPRFIPQLTQPILGEAHWQHLPFILFPLLGLLAALSVPRVDAAARELLGYRLANRLLGEQDLAASLQEVAAALRVALEADSARIHLLQPRTTAVDGEDAGPADEQNIPQLAETLDHRRVLVAPIGRESLPLGEVRLSAHRAGSFGRREREWLMAVLEPVAAAVRARHRESGARQQSSQVMRQTGDIARQLSRVIGGMPVPPREDGMGVPPPVDATEVLGQLKDGVGSAARQGETAEGHADAVRGRARQASDEIARALDSVALLSSEVERLTRAGEEIAASNETVSAIAFRTNLLANNAALEATRSGSAGRSFGVLAEEIRRLADSTGGTSSAIGERTSALAREVALRKIREALATAIRETEGVEQGTRHLNETVGQIGGTARALQPAIEEAYAVASRRSARDRHQSGMLEQFLDERQRLAEELIAHRAELERLGTAMEKVARPPA